MPPAHMPCNLVPRTGHAAMIQFEAGPDILSRNNAQRGDLLLAA